MCEGSPDCYCDHFPDKPVTLDELIEALEGDPPARRILERSDRASLQEPR